MKVEPNSELPKMSAPAHRALSAAGYTSLDQLTAAHEKDIAKLHGMGPKALRELKEALAAQGMSFAE